MPKGTFNRLFFHFECVKLGKKSLENVNLCIVCCLSAMESARLRELRQREDLLRKELEAFASTEQTCGEPFEPFEA